MKVGMTADGPRLTFTLTPQDGDRLEHQGMRFDRDVVHMWMPEQWSAAEVHPDLFGLAAILLCGPFGSGRVELPVAVSEDFADRTRAHMRKQVLPVEPGLHPRTQPADGMPALNFSGGVDSVAALAVLPDHTALTFVDRVVPDGASPGAYRPDAAYHAIRVLQEQHGRTVWCIRTDLEFVRTPRGFPFDISNALPTVLLADLLGIDAQGWGTILESAYGIGRAGFTDYGQRHDYEHRGAVFAAVGLPYLQSVAGVSEVGSTMIEARSPYAGLGQSCIRGRPGQPCLRCRKCFRKELLGRVLRDQPIDDALIDTLVTAREVQAYLTAAPIKHEDVLAYLLPRYRGSHPAMRLLRQRVARRGNTMDWLERSYSPAVDLLPPAYQAGVRARLGEYLDPMGSRDEDLLRAWDPYRDLDSRRRRRAQRRLEGLLVEPG